MRPRSLVVTAASASPAPRPGAGGHQSARSAIALFDLVGLRLSPRIRDLGKIPLYRTAPRASFLARYPQPARRLNGELIAATWEDLMRVAASVKGGHATAALVVGKLGSAKRQQNALTAAIKENGALRRTVCARYLHALRRSLAYAGEGALRRRCISPA